MVKYADPAYFLHESVVLEVFLLDGRQSRAQFVGGDERNDIAVIKIELDKLPVAEMGDSSLLEIGEPVVAIGNPLGMEFAGSVTTGVVSALNRSLMINDTYLELIQTDAAINPGNSGGALVNSRGQVIGINSVKVAVHGVEGIGFAIPANDARNIAKQLIEHGRVVNRASFGIRGREITQVYARLLNTHTGFFVSEVQKDKSAYKAGIRKGDIIVAINGREVKSIKDIYRTEKNHTIGETVNLVIVRDEKRIALDILFL